MTTLEMNNYSNGIPSILKCCLSNDANSHIAEYPTELSCGHWTCRECILPGTNYKSVKYNTCQEVNSRDLLQPIDPKSFKFILEQNINNIFQSLCKEFNDKIKASETAISVFKEDFKEIQSSIKTKANLNETNLYKLQNKIKSCDKFIKCCTDLARQINSFQSEDTLNGGLIGETNCSLAIEDAIQRIKTNKHKTINIGNCYPYDVCFLPNGDKLICNFDQSNISIFDGNNQLRRTIDTIEKKNLRVISACTNDADAVYLSNNGYHTIIKTDLSFNNQLASFGIHGENGSFCNHLYNPRGICFYNNSIYVCDMSNGRIQKLNEDLVHQQSFKLNLNPWYIKVLNNVACVRMSNTDLICFYDLKTFNELKRYNHNGIIGVSKQCFIEYYYPNKSFYCYDKNGVLLEQIKTTNDFGFSSNRFGGLTMCERTDKFILYDFQRPVLVFI